MKEKIMAVVLLVLLISAVCINTLFLTSKIDEITDEIKELSIGENKIIDTKTKAECIYNSYKDSETIISLTVSHNDLTNIEDCFVEMIGYLSVNDVHNARVTQSRLINSLEHLRRLSGFNIDSII